MKKSFILTLLATCITSFSVAQSIHKSEGLLSDIVKVNNDKYNIDILKIIQSGDNTSQIKLHAESATNVISRDNFLYFSTLLFTTMVDGMIPEDGFTREIDELIGNADVVVNIYMTKNGLQIETIGAEGIKRTTKKWDEL